MNYYLIGVSSRQFYAAEELTYSSSEKLKLGQIVEVELKNKPAIGVVLAETAKPEFKTKPINLVFKDIVLPEASLHLIEWFKNYYPCPLGFIVSQFIPSGLNKKSRSLIETKTTNKKVKLPALTAEQQAVLKDIKRGPSRSFLLHGQTGSGKTRVYIELAAQTLNKNQSAIILTPEISLTPQLEKAFTDSFGDQVVLTHSNLTPAERKKVWLKCLNANQPLVVVGPRSALFMPLKNIGLMVVDEFHEPAYKQESHPKYQAARVASALGQITKALVIFGSATPPVVDFYLAEQKNVPILVMKEKAVTTASTGVEIEVIDLKDKTELGSQPFLSRSLVKAIGETLNKNEQVLLFLNRRGHTRLVFCKVCSWQALCPNCNIPLTYHLNSHTFKCHLCNYSQKALSACPNCKNTDISFAGIGTQALSLAIKKLFPNAKVQRFDSDNNRDEQISANFEAVASGDVEILIGTQILAKGLDLPKLGLVSMIMADSSLQFPDYTAAERTYQLISQIIGRVGRGHRQGQAIIQTYSPDSPVLNHALRANWPDFYKEQLIERKMFGYPPFYHVLKLEFKHKNQAKAEAEAKKMADNLAKVGLKIEITGPSPSFIEKQRGLFHQQIIIKAKNRQELTKAIQKLTSVWSYDLDPINLL